MSRDADQAREFAELFRAVYLTFHRRDGPRSQLPNASLAVLEHLAPAGPLTTGEAAAHLCRQATHEVILAVDLYGTALVLEEFGNIIAPLARDELTGPRGEGYRRMIELCPARRAGTPDEVGTLGALLMGPGRAFITGSDFLMDGGVTASYFFGELAPN